MKTKKIKSSVYTLLVVFTLAMILSSCSKDNELDAPMINTTQTDNALSNFEQEDLIYLAEKEKFHRDVYQTIYDANQLAFVSQLCNCDENFLDQLSIKIDKYGLDNPVINKATGEFENTGLQYRFNYFETIDMTDDLITISFAKEMEAEMLNEIQLYLEQLDGNADLRAIYLDIQAKSQEQYEELESYMLILGDEPVIEDDPYNEM